jgi:GR25 family glycosyltransferase involved in LPS biosynthesis
MNADILFDELRPRTESSFVPNSHSTSAAAAVLGHQIPVYVINLAKDAERWRNIERSLQDLRISPIRVRGIDGSKRHSLIRRLVKYNFANKDWGLTPGEIGCALSHIGIWKRVARSGLPAVIFEDDAVDLPAFKEFYAEDLPLFLQRCDIVKFEGLFCKNTSLSGPMLCEGRSTKLIVSFRPTVGAAGYALTQRGAKALLSRAAEMKVAVPIDHVLVRYDEHGAVYGETRPFLVRQARESYASNIEPERIIEDERMTKILRNYSASAMFYRRVRRSISLMGRGVRRALAMTRIVLFARFVRPISAIDGSESNRSPPRGMRPPSRRWDRVLAGVMSGR